MGEDVDILQIKAKRFSLVVIDGTGETRFVSRKFRFDCCIENGRRICWEQNGTEQPGGNGFGMKFSPNTKKTEFFDLMNSYSRNALIPCFKVWFQNFAWDYDMLSNAVSSFIKFQQCLVSSHPLGNMKYDICFNIHPFINRCCDCQYHDKISFFTVKPFFEILNDNNE